MTTRNEITERKIVNATRLPAVLSKQRRRPPARIPSLPESGVTEYVASAVEINQMIKIIFKDFE